MEIEKVINSIIDNRQELIDEYSELNAKLSEKENKTFDLLVAKEEEKVKVLFREAAEMRDKAEILRMAINDLGNALSRFGYTIVRI